MSDSVVELNSATGEAGVPPTTAGDILKNARQAAGIHIEALAVALKVPVSKLEALESNNFDLLSDTVFLRALASSVCRSLKLDPSSVLSLLPQSQSPRLVPERTDINTAVRTTSKTFVTTKSSRHSSWLMVCVLLLLAGAAAVVYWPSHFQPWEALRSKEAVGVIPPVAESVVSPSASASGAGSLIASASSPEVLSPPDNAQANAPQPSGAPLQPVATAQPSSADATASAEAAEAPLVLRTRGESWVQVRDGSGRVVFEKKMAQGDSAPVSGVLPLSVVVGRADVTDVYVRGKPFELNSVSRENVARFEVKQ